MNSPFSNGTFELDKNQLAATQVYDYLRSKIIKLEFKPGTILSRPEIARFFNVSITPVRDALLRLEDEGLIDILPQHATRVRAIDIDSARLAHFLRLTLELEVARTLARQGSEDLLPRLRALVDKQRACWDRKDLEGFVSTDQEFHRELFCAAKLERLWQMVRGRSGNMDRLRRLHIPLNGKADAILHEHADLVEAIAARSPERAESWVRQHLGGTMSQLIELRKLYPEYMMEKA